MTDRYRVRREWEVEASSVIDALEKAVPGQHERSNATKLPVEDFVYVLVRTHEDWEMNDSTLIGVYTSLQKAQERIDPLLRKPWENPSYLEGVYWRAEPKSLKVGENAYCWEIEKTKLVS